VNEAKVKPRETPGLCFLEAGFRVEADRTKGGLLALRLAVEDMPEPCAPLPGERARYDLFAGLVP
jgi:hypothetical protein